MEYVLKTENLSKLYINQPALKGLNMQIPKGAIYGLIGRNGSGKTTLIRIICGLQKPTLGEYYLYGLKHNDRKISQARRRMSAIAETPSIYLDMSARDNLIYHCKLLGLPSYDSIDEILNLTGLENVGSKKVSHFSLGMKQRLGIALTLTSDPDFIVLDEPVNGLDPQGIVTIRELILKINREKGVTFLISSHILNELSAIATHFGFIDKGTLIKQITRDELEEKCKKCVRVQVSDIKVLTCVLEEEKIEYEILADNEADIFGDINISELVVKLYNKGCNIVSINELNETLESYYINLVGGDSNA